ncbi:hypothetical protein IEQ34_020898 [Dendrobium chrysotoxum]|uniref:Ubiquitin-like protease family profile domain-containing protein n=1 Tax=Dendrobium chrysotoxum TaxID=161865 RepID=A0AAV7G1N3_DENCH|nr:hypothetical protein IEQ34_020898 [Dendrobium chrysotoxum]
MPYQRPVTSRCYVTTFRKICDAFVEIIDDEVEQTFRNLKIHQFLKFPAFQQCIPLLYEILKFWNAADEGFVVNDHLLKFTSDEVSLLTGLPNRGDEIKWKVDPLTGPLSTDIKTEITKLDRLYVNATKIKTFIMFLLSNLFFPLNNHKTPRRLISIANNVNEFNSINWASCIRNFMINEFNTITDKFAMEKPLGYINGFFPLLLIWFLEHFSCNKPSNPESRPRFLRWEGNTEMYYTQESATKLFKFLKKNELYKGYKHDYQMFIQHITPDSVRESKLIVQPICFQSHWVLIVGKLKEKVWKLYDSLPNPEHKAICTEVIKQIHEDKAGVFPSDITTWKLQTVRGIPTQSNEYDCGIFVCKYMEKAILKKKTDWASLKEWQKYMPKFRAELGYALCLTTKM